MTQVIVYSLWLPILLTTAVMFVAGFLSWCILPHHKPDWKKLPNEKEFLDTIGGMNIPAGNYMYPHCPDSESMRSAEYQQAVEQNTFGTLQSWGAPPNMGKNLACQVVFLLVANFCLAYLSTLALDLGDDFMTVFRFVATAAFLTYTVGVVPGSIWFKLRLPGYIIDGVIHALLAGAVFAWLWPSGPAL